MGKSPEWAKTEISKDLTSVSGVWGYLGWKKIWVLADCKRWVDSITDGPMIVEMLVWGLNRCDFQVLQRPVAGVAFLRGVLLGDRNGNRWYKMVKPLSLICSLRAPVSKHLVQRPGEGGFIHLSNTRSTWCNTDAWEEMPSLHLFEMGRCEDPRPVSVLRRGSILLGLMSRNQRMLSQCWNVNWGEMLMEPFDLIR